ncbi:MULTISPECIES: phenylalanine--tRNA ligase subunit beta [Acidobacterium]|uniref:Phenylalanine--tRNA ligase beta subunit n=1 Tax=Acidobacterium capsulatum (strain ATCC 51196 / DSM 11244 / BCRC 80197 / JCM 7670 / NBRC 15755 / NCIMB 13165 / 161) TaxID=240015 RepID=C1F7U8_ACIC5|nr:MULTISPECIES: phenylalanine--tRNA ligase subunit beta [Acidobacterium]ACO31685.1 phenylalanyl-tRNA synthetase, beta subunit [Acidobacterium capsulatum ATCC 51196]HCT59713.1 phenylalanine--tRNA ligase subunit beta [Acidobacterium sp.]
MRILTQWLRDYVALPSISDAELADALTLRGIAVDGVFDLGAHGSVFEMDVTTNRVDAMNHYGVAREASIIFGCALKPLDGSLPAPKPGSAFPVRIEEPTLCGRFTARVLRGVTIQPSHGIVAERFAALEQKLISNAVDATNFVTLGMGHPTHAFDLDKLEGGIVVRRARKGEKLVTLDGVERTLDPDDLVVADEKKAVGLAGVMGGLDTAISASTKNILVEAAWFDQNTVRRSSRRHGIHTDASHRFERGADFNAPPLANALVSRIILEAGGHIEGELVDVLIPEAEARTAKRAAVSFAVPEIARILGATEDPQGITAADAEGILTGLGCTLEKSGEQSYSVTLPSWRLDLEREIDLLEEIARVYGYNRFQNTLPTFAGSVVELPWAAKEATLRGKLLGLGWNEAISSTFCAEADALAFCREPNSAVAVGNPLSEEAGMLRPSLLPGMLTMLANNLSRDVESVALFEIGTVFTGSTEKVDERPALAIGATGRPFGAGEVDFYDLKGTLQELLHSFTARSLYFDRFPAESGLMPAWLHPGRSARAVIDGATVGYFGQLHPAEAERRKVKQTVLVGELYLDRLYKQSLRTPVIEELSRYQAVRRDFSFLVPDAVSWGQLAEAIVALPIPELRSFAPREILRGERVAAGHYSLLLGTVFQSHERTLRDEDLQAWAQQVIAAMQDRGAQLRS